MQASWQDMPGPRRQFKTTRSNLFSSTGHQGIGDVLTRAGVLQSGADVRRASYARGDDEDEDVDLYDANDVEEDAWLVAADDRVRPASRSAFSSKRYVLWVDSTIASASISPAAE